MNAQPWPSGPYPAMPHDPLFGLVFRVAQGDERALGELYDRTCARVYGLALRIVGDAGAAEEVTVDVFHQAWRQAPRYDRQRGTPLAWLLTVARSRALDRLRADATAKRREAPLDEELTVRLADPAPTPEAQASAQDLGVSMRLALQGLPREQAQVIELAFYTGLSHSQIAQRLEQPLGTVKTRIRLGMQHLADHWSQQEKLG